MLIMSGKRRVLCKDIIIGARLRGKTKQARTHQYFTTWWYAWTISSNQITESTLYRLRWLTIVCGRAGLRLDNRKIVGGLLYSFPCKLRWEENKHEHIWYFILHVQYSSWLTGNGVKLPCPLYDSHTKLMIPSRLLQNITIFEGSVASNLVALNLKFWKKIFGRDIC